MKKAFIFVIGGSGTVLLSAFLFVLVPRLQVSEVDKEGLSAQAPYTEAELRGRHAYMEYGCYYCHSQQVRDPSVGADADFGWGPPSRPSDYIYDKPQLLGTSRTGPDLSNIGSRQPSRDWQHLHLYDPRHVVDWSIMPDFSFLYERVKADKSPAEGAIAIDEEQKEWIVPSQKAQDLVDYLLSLKRDGEPVKHDAAAAGSEAK